MLPTLGRGTRRTVGYTIRPLRSPTETVGVGQCPDAVAGSGASKILAAEHGHDVVGRGVDGGGAPYHFRYTPSQAVGVAQNPGVGKILRKVAATKNDHPVGRGIVHSGVIGARCRWRPGWA